MDNQPVPPNQTPPPATPPINPETQIPKNSKTWIIFIIASVLVIAIGFGSIILIKSGRLPFNITSFSKPNPIPKVSQPKPVGAIAKAGEEYIYQKDLDTELKLNPVSSDSAKLKKELLEKLITDSIILQGAQADKIATPDATFYNSPRKDIFKRYQLIIQIKKEIENKADSISGYKITIWFLNDRVGPLGYDQAKKVALEKITKLQGDVVSKKITIQQAKEAIVNDASMAQLDRAYKTNAGEPFRANRDRPITITKAFDDALWSTAPGGVTQVITGQSNDKDHGNKIVDAYFTFGSVDKKTTNGISTSFDAWLAQKRRLYAISYF